MVLELPVSPELSSILAWAGGSLVGALLTIIMDCGLAVPLPLYVVFTKAGRNGLVEKRCLDMSDIQTGAMLKCICYSR